MRAAGLQTDVLTCNAAISACEKGQQWQRALLGDTPAAAVQANAITYNAAISACQKGQQLQ